MKRSASVVLFAFTLAACFFAACFLYGCSSNNDNNSGGGGTTPSNDVLDQDVHPIVFVHGKYGSGDQFQAQALRFASNGYPENYFAALDYNPIWDSGRITRLDQIIDDMLEETGAEQVDLVGHSTNGTTICQTYLSDESRAAKVAHYINIDGIGGDALFGNVPTLNLMASEAEEEITGATNIELANHTHVQAVSSPLTFEYIYEFFTAEEPVTNDIMPSSADTIELKGKLVEFATNSIPQNFTLSIYEVDPDTGQRLDTTAVYSESLPSDGVFDFSDAKQGSAYEFEASETSQNNKFHWFYEPFFRTDTLIRLKYSNSNQLDTSSDSSIVTIIRNREMIGKTTTSGYGVDSIAINDTEVCEDLLPASGTIGLVVFDKDSDGSSDLDDITSTYRLIPYVSSVDLYLPASTSGDGIINITIEDRYSGDVQSINIPNFSSTYHKSSVQFIPR